MRVTQNMLNRNLTYAMGRNFERLNELNRQLSSGQRVNTMSDDVVAAQSILELRREKGGLDAFLGSLSSVRAMLSVGANSLERISEVISSAKPVAMQAASGTYSDSDRQAMAASMNGMVEMLVTLANVRGELGYVFSGEASERAPYTLTRDADGQITDVTYAGETISTQVQVSPTTMAEANLVGDRFINRHGDLFGAVIGLRDAIAACDQEEIERLIGEMDECTSDIAHALGRLGERMSQMDMLRNATETFRGFNQELISERQDADIAGLSVEYNTQMVLLQLVMKVAAQAIPPSLADFL